MTTYYVRKTGNDSTGTGATGAPWLTIAKALTVMVAGDVLNIGAGTYAENSSSTGRLQFVTAYASLTTFQTESGAQDVTITGASDATINTIFNSGAANVYLKNLTFAMRASTNGHAVRIGSTGAGIVFENCAFVVTTNSGQVNAAVNFQSGGAVTCAATFTGCTFSASGSDNARGVAVVWTAGNTITAVFTNCTCTMTGDSLYFNGGTVTVNGGTWLSAANHTLLFGADSHTGGNACTATVTGATIICTAGHALAFGNGCTSCTVTGSLIIGGDYAVVLKEHTGSTVQGNRLYSGTAAAVYFKASNGGTIKHNLIVVNVANAVACKLAVGDTGNKSTGVVFTDNVLRGEAAGTKLFDWDDSTADAGGGTCDRNRYAPSRAGTLGDVVSATGITTLTALRAAWAGYDVATNDSRSRLVRQSQAQVLA